MGTVQNDSFYSSYLGDQIDLLLAAMAQANPLPSGTDWVAFIDDCREAQNSAVSAKTAAAGSATEAATSASYAARALGEGQRAASHAGQSAEAASTSAADSEAWAVGQRGGADVPDTDPTYHNNAKCWAAEAQAAASTAGDYERSARAMATAASGNATSASESATSAFESAVAASGSAASAANSATAATAAADLAEAWSAHPPYIGANGNWYVWNTESDAYTDSGVDASITVTIADITSIAATATPYVTNTGTATDPIFHLFIPQAKSIVSIAKTATSGLTDTYTITLNDGTSTTFTVVNGADGYSPVVTVTAITDGHRVTITDAAHPSGQSFDVMDGTGDMLASTYDSQGAVAAAGGIPAYVSAQLNTAIADAIGGSY